MARQTVKGQFHRVIFAMLFVFGFSFSNYDGFAQCATVINTFPYTEDFEISQGNWTPGGTLSDWAWGTPNKSVITGAGSGVKCWITGGLSGAAYNGGERSFVTSPCFDFTNLAKPEIAFKIFWETENQYDGANLQYSIDLGITWINVGQVNGTTDCLNANWYNASSITNLNSLATVKNGWCGNIQPTIGSCVGGGGSNGWLIAKQAMPYLAGQPQVLFRFTFGAGTACNSFDGFAFDAVSISEATVLTLSSVTTETGCIAADGTASISVIGGSAPYSYSWSPNVSSTSLATGLSAATYTVTVTEAGNCTSSISLTVSNSPAVNFTVTTSDDTCMQSKGTAMLNVTSGTAPYSYSWSANNVNAPFNSQLNSGNYMVTVSDTKGCSMTSSFTIYNTGNAEINLGTVSNLCGANSIVLNPGNFVSYLWQDLSVNSTYTVFEPGIYSVFVTDSSGCTDTDSIKIELDCGNDVFVPRAFTPNDDLLNEVFLAKGIRIEYFKMVVFNRDGQQIFESDNINNGWNGSYNGQPVPQGVYVWRIDFRKTDGDNKQKEGAVLLLR